MPISDVRAVYFDLDDTLCGYWDAAKIGLEKTFAAAPDLGPTDVVLEHWATEFRVFCGSLKTTPWYPGYLKLGEPTRTELMRLTLLRLGIDDPVRARLLGDQYGRHRDRALELFPEVPAVLDQLQKHFPLGLITNGPADIQRQEIATLDLDRYMTHIFIEGEMGRGKPIVEIFHEAAAAVSLESHQILFVGNSYGHDIAPAINAGWRTAWIRRPSDVPPSAQGKEARPESLPVGAREPDLMITSLDEIIAPLRLS